MRLLLYILTLLPIVIHGAQVKIIDLPLATSPSTNTFIEIADMNAATKSSKYLLTNKLDNSRAAVTNALATPGDSSLLLLGNGNWGIASFSNITNALAAPNDTAVFLNGKGLWAAAGGGSTNLTDSGTNVLAQGGVIVDNLRSTNAIVASAAALSGDGVAINPLMFSSSLYADPSPVPFSSNVFAYACPASPTYGGLFWQINATNNPGVTAGGASALLFSGSFNGSHTNHMGDGIPMFVFTGGHIFAPGAEEALDTGEPIFGISNDYSPVFGFMVNADVNTYLPAGYCKIGINTNTPTATLEVNAYNATNAMQKWSHSDGTVPATMAYDGSFSTVGAIKADTVTATNGVTAGSSQITDLLIGALAVSRGTLTHAGGNVIVDFALTNRYWSCTLTGNVTFVLTNASAGKWANLLLYQTQATNCTPTFNLPAGTTNWFGGAPSTLTAGTVGALSYYCIDSSTNSTKAAYAETQ